MPQLSDVTSKDFSLDGINDVQLDWAVYVYTRLTNNPMCTVGFIFGLLGLLLAIIAIYRTAKTRRTAAAPKKEN